MSNSEIKTKRKEKNEDEPIFDSTCNTLMDFADKIETTTKNVQLDIFEELPVQEKEDVVKELLGEILGNLLDKRPDKGKEDLLVKCFQEFMAKLPEESRNAIHLKMKQRSSGRQKDVGRFKRLIRTLLSLEIFSKAKVALATPLCIKEIMNKLTKKCRNAINVKSKQRSSSRQGDDAGSSIRLDKTQISTRDIDFSSVLGHSSSCVKPGRSSVELGRSSISSPKPEKDFDETKESQFHRFKKVPVGEEDDLTKGLFRKIAKPHRKPKHGLHHSVGRFEGEEEVRRPPNRIKVQKPRVVRDEQGSQGNQGTGTGNGNGNGNETQGK